MNRDLDHLIDLEEVNWKQKSQVLWLKDGDRCTKFFHQVANSISHLEVDREVVKDPADISKKIVSFFTTLYEEPLSWRPSLDGLEFDTILGEDADWLEKPFEEEEVSGVVHCLNREKALGLDGFSLVFYQSFWDVIK